MNALKTWAGHLGHILLQLVLVLNQATNIILSLPFPGAWRGAWADETMSCRSYRADRDGKLFGRFWRPIIDALFFWQKVPPGIEGHCHWAYVKESAKYNLPPEMRQ
jgi:hypothetical protein